MTLQARALSDVERARIIPQSGQGQGVPEIARTLDLYEPAVWVRIKRFNTRALAGLADAPHRGRPASYTCEQVGQQVAPEIKRVYAILDNLNSHHADDVLLFCARHPRWEFVFQPQYAAYLNLIEPWWKVLHSLAFNSLAFNSLAFNSLAFKGRRFETWAELAGAVRAATAYRNAHKRPLVWGDDADTGPARRAGIGLVPPA